MTARSLHPFPARMAPELVLRAVARIEKGACILDPMVGSGTVIDHAIASGHVALGRDLDPLALLISTVRVLKIEEGEELAALGRRAIAYAKRYMASGVVLPWIDDDQETKQFIEFWFGYRQRPALRALAAFLHRTSYNVTRPHLVNCLRVAFSRLIITKTWGASLAWDVSHSRPHRVYAPDQHKFDVIEEFEKSVRFVVNYLSSRSGTSSPNVMADDARILKSVESGSVDAVITSPPYLNAIDYLRGHRMSLVWFGYSMAHLRAVRGDSIGAERSLGTKDREAELAQILNTAYKDRGKLPANIGGMLERYCSDMLRLMNCMNRVLKLDGEMVLVVGDSTLRNVRLENSKVIRCAATLRGFEHVSSVTRQLPVNARYLPVGFSKMNSLEKRMKEEVVMRFKKVVTVQ